ncbi:cation-transporting ATPase; E1-E2 ATPase [Synechocystis sp. PCC 6803]|uniref:Cation-transporting ATPase E1-E2 ATPase n=1 Tax=Synechocystis sp. (strain ATCC 27184 / PCC 6803 / Kazusa) TaxID=1111708 RepID=Q59997_SYNY3|nr:MULTISPECIES: heavy metal translocating P-type ATPase [unclassified Synechocystis]BAM53695.1 cation-transporting ATPase E1-E2 ATPase [Synechocystis sp. PCC 6803] [Bacillus subtilis BEST7613]AGF52995.1 cation-transporting ATPase E1-E2 ATPase [Synechocystis sp. PCC 6803]ALJ68887.1 ATPase [Synechocystis sp. PCC 6803]AVP90751.1 heavy metal translocating P-type ATPase [Synechocystis sp. IPPAS B-1465]MBD2618788.1 heavy metal translocating P-type ATPase [Synechocystis sp. FACHB-898]
MVVTPPSSAFRFSNLFKDHPDAVAAIACGGLVFLGWQMLNLGWLGIAFFVLTAAYVIGGFDNAREGLTTLFEEKEFDVDLLMIVAALGAAGLGLWRREYTLIVDGAVLILIFAISGALEGYAMQRTERSIQGLMSLTADVARVLRNGQEQTIPISELKMGDQVLVKPGELVPTDGLVIEGFSTLNQASITGESMPVEKAIGDEVFAGTINGNGVLRLKIHQPPESSLIQRVIRLVQQAQTEAPPSQQFIERFECGYAKVIVIAGLLLGTLPPFLLGWSWEETIYRALIFLVVASPCALMASIMPALLSGIANGARQGILFKNGAQLERIGRVRVIAFDKTGTLTTGKPEVVNILATQPSTDKLLQIAAALESLSEHPIGEAIADFTRQQNQAWATARNVQAQAGQGIIGDIEGQQAIVGKAVFVQAQVNHVATNLIEQSQQWEAEGKTVVWVAYAGEILGLIAVADTVRPTAAQAIARLKRLGIERIVMLTGDNSRTAHSIAQQVGVNQVYAELLPEDKVDVIRQLQKQYQSVAMVGDGINDAPALAQASVGIAMGAAGSDVALETADIVLMADRLERLEHAIRLGRRAQGVVKQNIVFALGFVMILLIANFAGNITLPFGVLGHEGSTVIVTLSGLRLLRG